MIVTTILLVCNHGLENLQDEFPKILVLDLSGADWVDDLKKIFKRLMHSHLTLIKPVSKNCEDA